MCRLASLWITECRKVRQLTIENNADWPQVSLLIVLLASQQLWCHVQQRATQIVGCIRLTKQVMCKAEIYQQHHQPTAHTHIGFTTISWFAHWFSYSHLLSTCAIFWDRSKLCKSSLTSSHNVFLRYLVPPLGVTPFGFCRDLYHLKTTIHGLSCGIVCMILRLAISVEHWLVTDRQTWIDRHDYGIYRTSMVSCGKKLSDEVLAWLSVWSDVQRICIWSS